MNTISFTYEGGLQVAATRYSPWPAFAVQFAGTESKNDANRDLKRILQDEDPFCLLWRRLIPQRVVAAVLQYEADLVCDVLAFAQADAAKFLEWHQWSPCLVAALCGAESQACRGQRLSARDAAGMAGFPPTRSVLRIISKVPIEAATKLNIELLRQVLREPYMVRVLRHVDRIGAPTFGVLRLPPDMVDSHLILQSAGPSGEETAATVLRLERLRRLSGTEPGWPYRGRHVSIASLQARCSELEKSLGPGVRHLPLRRFAPPPISCGNNLVLTLKPVRDIPELVAEGKQMRNCLPLKLEAILARLGYAYQLLAPMRATVYLERLAEGGSWHLGEVRGRGNAEVPLYLEERIKRWVEAAQQKDPEL